MSRIQHILERAERDGYARRLRGHDVLASSGGGLLSTPADAGVERDPTTDSDRPADGLPASTRVLAGTRLDPRLITAFSTDSVSIEQYRALRTRVLQADISWPVRVLLVTSPGAGEGRTLTTANLGLAMAQDHTRRTCLVEADVRKPQAQRLFGLPDGPGLCDVLSGHASLADALVTLEEHQITILPAGHVPSQPAELLATSAMRRVVDSLRAQFDRVVMDAPAITPLADVGILTPLVDGLLVVVRAGATSKPAIRDALSLLDRSKLLGLVLNEAV